MAYDGTLKFDVELDTSNVEKRLVDLIKLFDEFEPSTFISGIKEGLNQIANSTSIIGTSVDSLGSSFQSVGNSVSSFFTSKVLDGGKSVGEVTSGITKNLGSLAAGDTGAGSQARLCCVILWPVDCGGMLAVA